jgi:membrane protein YqaA with SNARE-associated domain
MMNEDQMGSRQNESGSGWKGFLQNLRKKGFFRYVGRSILLIVLIYLLVVLLVYLLDRYLVDFNKFFGNIIEHLSDRFVIILFFLSESSTGMIPVDLFVVWTRKFEQPLFWLALLGLLSYAGGVISYGIGLWISRRPRIRMYTEKRLKAYIGFMNRWGGAFIVIAALFPFTPFSLVVIAVTLFHYPFRKFLLFALARLVRFVLQGVIFFDLLKLDHWII